MVGFGGGSQYSANDFIPIGTSSGASSYEQQRVLELQRQAALMAQQLNQAGATTSAMETQALGGQASLGNLSGTSLSGGSIASGSYLPPGGAGGYSLPGAGIPGGSISGTNALSPELQAQYDPWSQYRAQAGSELGGTIGQASPSDLYLQKLAAMTTGEFTPDDPSYQFRYQQGQQAAERSLASRGLLNSGNAAIELQQYGQGMASQEYGAQFNRMLQGLAGSEQAYDTQINRLMQMAGVNLDPTAGGQLAIQQGQLGVQQGQLGLNAQQIASNYDLGMRELVLKQQLAQQAQANKGVGGMSGTDWSSVFGS